MFLNFLKFLYGMKWILRYKRQLKSDFLMTLLFFTYVWGVKTK